MVERCNPNFDDPNCVMDHLDASDRARLLTVIVDLVDAGEYKQAYTWLQKAMAVDRPSGNIIHDVLMDELTVMQYAQLMAGPHEMDVRKTVNAWREKLEEGASEERSFKQWMDEVDRIVERKLGVSVYDLPDMPFRDSFDDGVTPEVFVQEDLLPEVGAEFGYDFSEDYE